MKEWSPQDQQVQPNQTPIPIWTKKILKLSLFLLQNEEKFVQEVHQSHEQEKMKNNQKVPITSTNHKETMTSHHLLHLHLQTINRKHVLDSLLKINQSQQTLSIMTSGGYWETNQKKKQKQKRNQKILPKIPINQWHSMNWKNISKFVLLLFVLFCFDLFVCFIYFDWFVCWLVCL